MNWLISANGTIYDHSASFKKRNYIDWRQSANYEIGDIIYIYSTRPLSKIEFKCIVEKNNMDFEDGTDDREFWIEEKEYKKSQKGFYSRLRLIDTIDSEGLILDKLKENGLKAAPQGPMRLKGEILSYVESFFENNKEDITFPNEVIEDSSLYEGSVVTVNVNKYERNSLARRKCIEHYGNTCMVCGFDFGAVYGGFAKGFIHVHHITPLSEIDEEYKVDFKKDLIPVCPNCHAMLHKKKEGKHPNIKELQDSMLK